MHYVTTKDGRLAAVINNRLIDLKAASIALGEPSHARTCGLY